MLYIDYIILRQSYDESLMRLKEAIDRKEEAFVRTLPNAIRYDLQKVLHSITSHSTLDDYVIESEKLEEQIRQARIIVIERKEMLNLKEEELRKSHDTTDVVYVMRYVDGYKVNQIAQKLGYRQESIYYHIGKIKHQLKKNGIIKSL